jgi:osmotically-inducible protein OsmY
MVVGVHDLVDEIDVRPGAALDPTDPQLQAMIGDLLTWDALVPERDLTVSVTSRWVTLDGAVAAVSQRLEAERAISHLAGVRGVTNQISVRELELSPGEVRAAIEAALKRRASHQAAHIDITVDGATVTVHGHTQSRLEKKAILGALSHAPGIDMVCDELEIEAAS